MVAEFDRDFETVKRALARYAALMDRSASASEREAEVLSADRQTFTAEWAKCDALRARIVASELRACLGKIRV